MFAWSIAPSRHVTAMRSGVHDFEKRTTHRAGALNVFIPGGVEPSMPSIVEWYAPTPDTEE